jgi:hypothetical protein
MYFPSPILSLHPSTTLPLQSCFNRSHYLIAPLNPGRLRPHGVRHLPCFGVPDTIRSRLTTLLPPRCGRCAHPPCRGCGRTTGSTPAASSLRRFRLRSEHSRSHIRLAAASLPALTHTASYSPHLSAGCALHAPPRSAGS